VSQQHPEIDVQVVRWEKITFAEKLATFRDMAVQVSGVGTAQNNAFLLPAGAVHVSLGWRHAEAKCRIHYFDSMTINSLDQARVLYRTCFDPWELAPPRPAKETGATGANVRLNLTKTTALIDEALRLQAAGFPIPVPEHVNSNVYDRAYEEMAIRSKGATHRLRTNDVEENEMHKGLCWTVNGIEDILWGRLANSCGPYTTYKDAIIRDFNL